ncbi:carboxylesterase [Pluteus cervinus]|uniref:Carboxylesterase n=1 Tax=Pluteus cervinus TaxID=181527 RepID=A0ACD3AS73_9AGAR|nr:carboxylesterase [Pluteus cervinus]
MTENSPSRVFKYKITESSRSSRKVQPWPCMRISRTTLLGLFLFSSSAVALGVGGRNELTVSTTSGRVKGFTDTDTTVISLKKWLGIRYAQDTSGRNRWQPPKLLDPNPRTVFNASEYGPACLQGRADGGNGTSIQSEDCLRINVIAPANASKLPVYLYSHGGGFDSGASSDPKIDGSFLAAKGIVFASYNYRLSLWGWPHASEISKAGKTQNLGLLDTRAAVEWLRGNVAQFGGDPDKITLGGESVGAEMTNLYLSAYPRDPIIRGAIMQSGDTAQPMWPENQQIELIAKNLTCPTGNGLLDCLRRKSGTDLREALLSTGAQFQPVTDNITIWKDYVAQTTAGHTARVPLLVGTNKDEGTLIVEGEPTAYLSDIVAYSTSNNLNFPFSSLSELQQVYPVPSSEFPTAYNATAAMWRDAHMLCLAHNLATHRTKALGLPVWRYRLDHVANNLNSRGVRIGAFHGEDIRFVMGTWRTIVLSPPFVPATPQQVALSDAMVEAWTNFVKDPRRGPRTENWKKYNPDDPSSIAIFGNTATGLVIPGNHTEVDKSCVYWNKILPIYPQTFPECGSWSC